MPYKPPSTANATAGSSARPTPSAFGGQGNTLSGRAPASVATGKGKAKETQADLVQRNITIAEALNEFVQTVQGVIQAHGKTPFIKSGGTVSLAVIFARAANPLVRHGPDS